MTDINKPLKKNPAKLGKIKLFLTHPAPPPPECLKKAILEMTEEKSENAVD